MQCLDRMAEAIYERPRDYDLEHAGDSDDIEFFLDLVTRFRPRRVLEIACGSGRVTIPLARLGAERDFDVVGIDISDAMLGEADGKRALEALEVRNRLSLVHGDVRTWRARAPFDLIVSPCASLSHLLTLEDQLAAWRRCRENLAEGGRLAVELSMPDIGTYSESLRTPPRSVLQVDSDTTDDATGERMLRYKATEYDPADQRAKILFVYDKFTPDAGPQRFLSDFECHVYYPREVQLLFMQTGFEVEALWGDYRFRTLKRTSRQLIAVGRAL